MKSVPANIYIETFFKAEVLGTEKCVQYNLEIAAWCNPLTKCKLASVNFEACFQIDHSNFPFCGGRSHMPLQLWGQH